MKQLIIIFIVIALALPVTGCKKKAPPPPKKKAEVKKEVEVKPVTPLTEEPATKSKGYVYSPAGRRDPFAPLIVLKRKKKAGEEAKRPAGTLESYDIGDFSLLAIVRKGYKHYALLLAPDNKSFTVYEGDTIGLHNGQIEKINDNKVIIVEYSKDYKGDKKPREVVLELHKEG